MRRPLRCSDLVLWVMIGFVLSVAASAGAQGRVRGEITDEWDNPIEGVTVLGEPTGSGEPKTTTTDDEGRFQFLGLSSGEWTLSATLEGYQEIGLLLPVRQLSNPAADFVLVAASGSVFGERLEFEAEGGTPQFRFEADGTFEFEDADGEGEGTYGIVELAARLIVRDYDGPDDKFTIKTPLVGEFNDTSFSSMTLDGVVLQQQ